MPDDILIMSDIDLLKHLLLINVPFSTNYFFVAAC